MHTTACPWCAAELVLSSWPFVEAAQSASVLIPLCAEISSDTYTLIWIFWGRQLLIFPKKAAVDWGKLFVPQKLSQGGNVDTLSSSPDSYN